MCQIGTFFSDILCYTEIVERRKTSVKKILPLLLLSTAVIGVGVVKVKAESDNVYYTNPNGINLTEKEYNLVKEMFDERFLEVMNQDDYNFINRLDVNNRDVELSVKEPDYIGSRSTYLETNAKKLAIGKSCSTKSCTVTITNSWKYEPKVKSYDVIGAMLVGTTFVGGTSDAETTFKLGSTNHVCNNYVKTSNGVGCSYKIASGSGESIYTYQVFTVYTGGNVYGSYQHAGKSVSLSTSKNYRFHINGYGNVFLFNTTAGKDAYDAMGGVYVAL